jgi:NAD(P)-dependent dehydrogenase (short-subunit alcohol dehydrogenase family)
MPVCSGTQYRRVPNHFHTGSATLVALALAGTLTEPLRAAQSGVSSASEADQGRVILITGSTDGLGREVARRLAAGGAHIIVHGRNRERGMALVEEIERDGRGRAAFYAADFADLGEVRRFGDAILRDYERLDVLVNNAGLWLPGSDERRLSVNGHELHFAVNYLSGFLLTRILLPLLERSAPARIINVASLAQTPIDFSDVMLEREYSGSRAYAQSKLAQVMFTFELAAELQGRGVSVNALHPATLMDTRMVQEAGVRPRSTVSEGAEAVVNLIMTTEPGSGQYFNGLTRARANGQAYDADARARLMALSRELAASTNSLSKVK